MAAGIRKLGSWRGKGQRYPETSMVPERIASHCLKSGMKLTWELTPSSLSLPSIPAHLDPIRNHRIRELMNHLYRPIPQNRSKEHRGVIHPPPPPAFWTGSGPWSRLSFLLFLSLLRVDSVHSDTTSYCCSYLPCLCPLGTLQGSMPCTHL